MPAFVFEDDRKQVFGLPFAVAALLGCVVVFVRNLWQLIDTILFPGWPNSLLWGIVIVVSIGMLCSLFVLAALIFKWVLGAKLGAFAFIICLVMVLIEFIIQWIGWGMALNGKDSRGYGADYDSETPGSQAWKPTVGEIIRMVIYVLFVLLICFILYRLIKTMNTLAKIYAAGGTGWHYQNIEDLENAQRREAAQGY